MRVNWRDNHPDKRSFQAVSTVAAEPEPVSVQVVEWVGLGANRAVTIPIFFRRRVCGGWCEVSVI